MTSIIESIWVPIVDVTESFGLIGYPGSSLLRFGVGALGAAIVLFFWKPSFAFVKPEGDDAKKVPKQWRFTADATLQEKHPEALATVPWWLAAAGVGLVFALFV